MSTNNTNLIPFTHAHFGQVRVIRDETTGGEPWFVARDVALSLGYAKPQNAIAEHCNYAKILKGPDLGHLTSSPRGIAIIPESDVYRLIIRSKLPGAQRFERWVMEEVLPSIRKTGAYMTPDTLAQALQNPRKMADILNSLADEQEARLEAEAKTAALEAQVEADAPYTEFAKALEISETTITVRQLAKIIHQSAGIDIGQSYLFQWLRDNGFLLRTRGKDHNAPSQRSINAGYMVLKTFIKQTPFNTITTYTPYITMKGKEYFLRTFAKMAAGRR